MVNIDLMVKFNVNDESTYPENINYSTWLEYLQKNYNNDLDLDLIKKSYALVEEKGKNTLTPFKLSSLQLAFRVSILLCDLKVDADTLASAFIHQVLRYSSVEGNKEDDKFNFESIRKSLKTLGDKNESISKLILNLQKMYIVHSGKEIQVNENLRRLLLAVVEDIRVVLIRLAEHLIELRLSMHLSKSEQENLAQQTLTIFAPLANRLGIGQIKWELEDLGFRYLEPVHYQNIVKLIDETRINREKYVQKIINQVKKALEEQDIKANVSGRVKHIYSIWKKMHRKGVGYDKIYDSQGIRILVSTIMECYATLGIIHGLWQHIPKEFDDYIANPKNNGYQSLHTAVIGPEGKPLEVQIRTWDMHYQSELGIGAHWRYKEGTSEDSKYQKQLENLRQILQWQEEWSKDVISNEALNKEFFKDWIYIITPKGDVIELPQDVTVLDFAYHIHTEIGHHCRGAKVNGRMVSLNHVLHSGDQVEILTSSKGGPSRDWLNIHSGYLTTSKARAKVHQWFKHLDRDKNIHEGRELLEKELKRLNVENINFEHLAHQLKFNKVDDFLANLGSGDIRVSNIVHAIQKLVPALLTKVEPKSVIRPSKIGSKQMMEVIVAGLGNVYCQMARCCKPIPGDEIIGYITIGKGVTVHRNDCINILNIDQNKILRLIPVSWCGAIQQQYAAHLLVIAYDRLGLLEDITHLLAVEKINVVAIKAKNLQGQNIQLNLSIEILNLEMLSKIISRIATVPNVLEVKRVGAG